MNDTPDTKTPPPAGPAAPGPLVVFRRELEGMGDQLKAALPVQIPVARFQRVVMTAIQNNPDLLGANRRSLWRSCMQAAQDGLLPDGREGAIVLFKKNAQFMPMIGGLRKKARNSGDIATWDVYAVHANDTFEFELGDEPFIRHKPALENAGALVAVYSVAVLKTGERSRDVMSIAEVERIRLRSRARDDGPWVTDYEEMAKKTVARRHSKVLPMSTDLDDLIRRDDDLMDVRGEVAERQAKAGGSALDVFATETPAADTTGETPAGGGDDTKPPPAAPADAYARGTAARDANMPANAVPTEWRENEPLASAWLAGWKERDAELAPAPKGGKK